MKVFGDVKIGDTVYRTVYANDSGYILNVVKEVVTAIAETHYGTVLKTENAVTGAGRGYLIEPMWYRGNHANINNCTLYWDKSGLVDEIDKCAAECQARFKELTEMLNCLEDQKTMTQEEKDQRPEYSCFMYHCGRKPHWSVGDNLAYHEFCTDREGEEILGKVVKVVHDKEEDDWLYTFENGILYDEQSLLEQQTFKIG